MPAFLAPPAVFASLAVTALYAASFCQLPGVF
jgi:hypothetical protein